MNLQDTFYLVAIISMSVATISFFVIAVFLIYVIKKLTTVIVLLEKNLDKASDLVSHPDRLASAIGGAVVDSTFSKVGNLWSRGKKAVIK